MKSVCNSWLEVIFIFIIYLVILRGNEFFKLFFFFNLVLVKVMMLDFIVRVLKGYKILCLVIGILFI